MGLLAVAMAPAIMMKSRDRVSTTTALDPNLIAQGGRGYGASATLNFKGGQSPTELSLSFSFLGTSSSRSLSE
jgi:hypothetical protein